MASAAEEPRWNIDIVNQNDLEDLLPLVRAYCQFYNQTEQIPMTSDDTLMAMSRKLIEDPARDGMRLIVRGYADRRPVAFATLTWNWSTLRGGRIAIMNDLYVYEQYRGQGIADMLIKECSRHAREHGALTLTWRTSVDNKRAQAVYDRNGASKSHRWLDYTLPL